MFGRTKSASRGTEKPFRKSYEAPVRVALIFTPYSTLRIPAASPGLSAMTRRLPVPKGSTSGDRGLFQASWPPEEVLDLSRQIRFNWSLTLQKMGGSHAHKANAEHKKQK
jgi:hypothetical protein